MYSIITEIYRISTITTPLMRSVALFIDLGQGCSSLSVFNVSPPVLIISLLDLLTGFNMMGN